ncbi:MAG: AMP-binding protein [Pseudomonadales bacterium]|nr:AMP-binding protein [Pseudomonadales bacterium]
MALKSISAIIADLAKAQPDWPAISHEAMSITRLELHRSTNRLARAYEALGVQEGDFVTIALPNSIEFYQACIATWKLGATPQPISAKLPRVEQIAIVDLAKPALLVGTGADLALGVKTLPANFIPDPTLTDADLTDKVSRFWKAPTSGGSTGRPKIIVSELPGRFDFSQDKPLQQEFDRAQLVPGPLYHNGPFSFSMNGLFLGNHIVVMTRFDAEQTLALIEAHKIDWMMMVPTMMSRIWKLPDQIRLKYDLSSLRVMLHLAAPCPPWLKEKWIEWLGGNRVHELFGGTEGTGATWITGDEWLAHRGSVGKLLGGAQVKVVDDQGETLPDGEIGEIYLLPPGGQGSTYHYIGAESSGLDGGWESLGDMGYVDSEGYIFLSDRKTDMILTGGANIYPAEVEAAIDTHPLVRSSAVIGLPDEDLGQSVHAIVDAAEALKDDDLLQHLTEHLARYKIPRTIEMVQTPLRDDAGKTRRSALLKERVAQAIPIT